MADMREERGKAIADQGNQIKKITDHTFKVKSQSSNRVYEVKHTINGMTCTCPDFVYRGGKCKHIMATRYYLQVEKDTPEGTVTEKVHLTYAQAWKAYNEAQKAEVKLFDDLLKDLVKAIPEPEQKIGRRLAYLFKRTYSVLSKRSILSYLADVHTAYSKTPLKKDKSSVRLISTQHPNSLTNLKRLQSYISS